MGNPLRHFVPRAPRYIFSPSDKAMLRFAHNLSHEQPHTTSLINLSTSGAAFLVPRNNCPDVGEILKVEFPLSDGQVAWFGRVVRVEEYARKQWWRAKPSTAIPDQLLVAIQFQELPTGHIKAIEKGLNQKWRDAFLQQKHLRRQMLWAWLTEKGPQYLMYVGLTAITFWLLYLLSLPAPNYDAKHGAPWGKRYQFFKWEKEEP